MQKQEPISNQTQIFRHDARGCFVEAKCDRFHLDRVHLQFVAYDKNRPQASAAYQQREHLYPHRNFWCSTRRRPPAYSMAGCSIRPPGSRSHSTSTWAAHPPAPSPDWARRGRTVKVFHVLRSWSPAAAPTICLWQMPDRAIRTSRAIVPRFEKNPEQHVAVSFSWKKLNEFLFTIHAHYMAWLSARYHAEWAQLMRLSKDKEQNSRPDAAQAGTGTAQNRTSGATGPRQPTPPPQPALPPRQPTGFGSMYGSIPAGKCR